MWTLPLDVPERLGAVAVDFDPENVEVGDCSENLEIAFGLCVEIEVEQNVDIRAGAVTQGFEMHDQIAQHLALDIDLGQERHAEAWPPAARVLLVRVVQED